MATTTIKRKKENTNTRVQIQMGDGKTNMFIPWGPESISINGNEIRVAEYEIIGRGQYQVPRGKNLRTISWDSTFPGVPHKDLPFIEKKKSVKTPQAYVKLFDKWKRNGTVIKVLIHQTLRDSNNKDRQYIYFYGSCLLSDYSATMNGPLGDIGYSVTLTEYREIVVTYKHKSRVPRKHRVVSGDTLYKISMQYWGSGSKKKDLKRWNSGIFKKVSKRKKYKGKSKEKKKLREKIRTGKKLIPGTVIYLYNPKKKPTFKKYKGKLPKSGLKPGSSGAQVKRLQKFLDWYYPNAGLRITGKFDSATEDLVLKFRKQFKLSTKGMVKAINKKDPAGNIKKNKKKAWVDKKMINKMKYASTRSQTIWEKL